MRNLFRPLALTIAIGLAGCSENSTPPTIEDTTFAASLGVNLAASTKTPSGVYYRDISVGTGATVGNGQLLSMRYTGWLADGTQFDSNVTGPAFSFHLGGGEVIDGWDLGIPGMKVGGQRQLIIPSELGYGRAGNSGIPGNAILVFNVQVVTAQ